MSPPKQKKKVKKKKKNKDDSDAEVYRKKKPKIKYGGLEEDEVSGRRTRGKKITYVDALGSDSDEDVIKKAPPRIKDSEEEEYVVNEDEDNEKDSDDLSEEEEEFEGQPRQTKPVYPENTPPPNIDAPLSNVLLPKELENPPSETILTTKLMTPIDVANIPLDPNQEFEEPNPIDEINKNVEQMDMEMMIEDEEYANKQLHLVAIQIEKERKRKEKEALKLELEQQQQQLQQQQQPPQQQQFIPEQKVPKKRGRKPKNYNPETGLPIPTINMDTITNSMPRSTGENNELELPKKRRGRGMYHNNFITLIICWNL